MRTFCLTCHKEFQTTPSRLKAGSSKYCSLACLKQKPKISKVQLVCKTCKKLFLRRACDLKSTGQGQFCSKRCFYNRWIPVCHPDRKHATWGLCLPCSKFVYYILNMDRIKKYNQIRARLYLYGITQTEYLKKLTEQNEVCAICKETSVYELAVDHNHTTEQVRGLLCAGCNTRLSVLENLDWVKKAEQYLVEWENKNGSICSREMGGSETCARGNVETEGVRPPNFVGLDPTKSDVSTISYE